jgi:quercetin dioxygenase-like cupin family protein
LQVLSGHVRLATATQTWEGTTGDYLAIPAERHSLTALDDSAVILTVALHGWADR